MSPLRDILPRCYKKYVEPQKNYVSEYWILMKTDTKRLEAAHLKLKLPLLGASEVPVGIQQRIGINFVLFIILGISEDTLLVNIL
jgi:hypothetical protein